MYLIKNKYIFFVAVFGIIGLVFILTSKAADTGITASDPITPRASDRQKYLEMTGPRIPVTTYNPTSNVITTQAQADQLRGKLVLSNLRIRANNITLRDVIVRSSPNGHVIMVESGFSGFTLEYAEVDCGQSGVTSSGITGGSNITVRYSHFYGVCDGIKTASYSTYEYNIVEVTKPPDAEKHLDAMQSGGPATDFKIRYSYLNVPASTGGNAALIVMADNGTCDTRGSVKNVVLENNYLNGGNYTVFAYSEADGPMLLRNNRFGRDYRYGIVTIGEDRRPTCEGTPIKGTVYRYGNVWDDNGQPAGNDNLTVPPPAVKTGDINGDNKVDVLDLSILLTEWSKTGVNLRADINNDSKIDVLDMSILLSAWNK